MIPIYRAKKIDSDELVEGYLFKIWDKHYILWGTTNSVPNQIRIDPNTLAIHFPNMIDKNGKKIFASLSEDGGDLVQDNYDNEYLIDFRYGSVVAVHTPKTRAEIEGEPVYDYLHGIDLELEVIGIHKC